MEALLENSEKLRHLSQTLSPDSVMLDSGKNAQKKKDACLWKKNSLVSKDFYSYD